MLTYKKQNEDLTGLVESAAFLNFVMKKKHFSADYLRWQYLENPLGKAISFCAYEDGRIIGHYAAQPILSKINGNRIQGLFILNAAVDPAYQGKGVFRGIADRLHEEAAIQNFRFIIGVGNKNSTSIYTNKLGFRSLGPLDVKFGLGLPVTNVNKEVLYERIWDEESFRWRLNNPNTKYYSLSKSDIAVLFRRNYPGLSTIMGIFNDSEFNSGTLINDKFRGINIYLGKNPAIDWKQNHSFISFPEVLKPSPLVLIFKELNDNSYPFTGKQIRFRCIDSDAF